MGAIRLHTHWGRRAYDDAVFYYLAVHVFFYCYPNGYHNVYYR